MSLDLTVASQNWLRQWLGIIRQQAWANVDPALYHHMVSLIHNELTAWNVLMVEFYDPFYIHINQFHFTVLFWQSFNIFVFLSDGSCCVSNVSSPRRMPCVCGRRAGHAIRQTISICSCVSPSSLCMARTSYSRACQLMTCCYTSAPCHCIWVDMSYLERWAQKSVVCFAMQDWYLQCICSGDITVLHKARILISS